LEPIPLGMENKQIKDHQINASSELYDAKYPDRYAAANGRLQATMYSRHSAWIGEANVNQWFEVNFIYNTTVKAIMTQGRRDYDRWVKYYQIKYRNHTSELEDYKLNPEVEKVYVDYIFVCTTAFLAEGGRNCLEGQSLFGRS
jgi:hypothetical protein